MRGAAAVSTTLVREKRPQPGFLLDAALRRRDDGATNVTGSMRGVPAAAVAQRRNVRRGA
jgi:hypothetical protein